jgi:ribose-phosphate pyrophosphokinase
VTDRWAILSGTAHPALAASLAQALGGESVRAAITRFPDGEIDVRLEDDLRGRAVAIVQPTVAPVGENLLELLLLADACTRAGADVEAAVVPYFGYARQDRRKAERGALGAKVVCELLGRGPWRRVVSVDLHADLEVALDVPLDHLSAHRPTCELLAPLASQHDSVVVAPDLGASKLAKRFGELLGLPVAIVHKTRTSGSEVTVDGVVGDVRGLRPILVDDMISTAGTIVAASKVLLAQGARPEIVVVATHALLVGDAVARLSSVPIRALVHADTVPVGGALPFDRIVVPMAPTIAEALVRTRSGRPLGELRGVR